MFGRKSEEKPVEPSALDEVKQHQKEMSQKHPELALFNLNNREELLAYYATAMALKGNSVEMSVTDEDGKVETIALTHIGDPEDTESAVAVNLTSSDGKFSPELAEAAASLEQGKIDDELHDLLSER